MNRNNQLKILLILLLAMSFVLPVQAGRARSAERAMEALAEANAGHRSHPPSWLPRCRSS